MGLTFDTIHAIKEYLRVRGVITALQSDILELVKELEKNPFDRQSAERCMVITYTKYPDVFAAVGASSPTPAQPRYTLSDSAVRENLESQLILLAQKELEVQGRGKQTGTDVGGQGRGYQDRAASSN